MPPKPGWRQLIASPLDAYALGFGSGLSPWAPGTAGTLLALPFWWWLSLTATPWLYLLLLVSAILLGIWAAETAIRHLGVEDHPAIVCDEMAAIGLTLLMVPPEPLWMVVGFLLFRLFDITKPWPVRWADRRIKGGFGVMFDDLLAAGYAWLGLQGLLWVTA